MIGTRLGSYEITARLGEGGMGEVYRATDSRLDREVAIKVLPAAFVEDHDRLARFEREARLLAQLNHPHIAQIYGMEASGESHALVMELVEGPTLAERIARGPIPLDEALPIARQIAEALEYAHERGIIHRDLKPANVKLTPEGEVKVLDFGLAKATDPATGSSAATDLAHSPTLTYQATVQGVILGTAAYMAPEQARGLTVDKRTDIWAFGVVLYEMLTGRSLFAAETVSDTLAGVLKSEIDLSSLPAETAPVVRRLLQRCLERDPRKRLRDIGEARIALEDPRVSAEPVPSGTSIDRTRPRLSMLLLPALAAALLAATVTALLLRGSGGAVSPEFQQLTFRRGTITGARFAPDGDTVVYSAAWNGLPSEIFTTRRSSPASRSLGLVDASLLAVSRQGELAVQVHPELWSGRFHGTLARVPLGGGAPRQVKDDVQEADWSADGKDAFVVRQQGDAFRWLVEDAAGKVLYRAEDGFLQGIRVSPDGGHLALLATIGWQPAQPAPIVVVDPSGEHRTLDEAPATGLAWSPSGDEIWYSQLDTGGASSLWAIDLSGRKRLLLRHAGSLRLLDAATNGTLLVSVDKAQQSVYFHSPASPGERDMAWLDGSLVSDIASDGSKLLLSEVGAIEGSDGGVYLRNTDGSPPVRLGDGFAMALSPDGAWALVRRGGGRDLVLVPTGAGQERQVPLTDGWPGQAWFAPDGGRLVVNLNLPDGRTRIVSIAPDGSDVRQLAPDGFDNFIGEHPLSPDGKWIDSQRGGDAGTLFPTDGSLRPREVPSFEPGDVVIRWSGDGNALFVFKRNELPARVDRLEIATGARTPWLELMPADPAGVTRISSVQMTADGHTYAYNVARQLSDLYLIRGVH